jgi:hypothetical protein
MTRSHQYLDDLYTRLLDAMEANAPDVGELWTELDHSLHAHMEAEERFVLPAFARVDRDEAVTLLRDHGKIREQLLELGVAVDLHAIRHIRSLEFIELLRAHAGREENLLYRWADQQLDQSLVEAALAHAAH